MSHQVDIPLRWGDMDAQGHINNGVYIDYLQEARVDWLLNGPHAGLLGSGILVVGHQIEFLKPVVFGPVPLTIELSVDSVGAAKLVVAYRVLRGNLLVARATTTLASYDLEAGKLRRLDDAERGWLREYRAPMEPFRELPKARPEAGGLHTPLFVRWGDLDAYGHVNNVRFFDYVQEARIQVIHEMLGEVDSELTWVVVRQDMRYLNQLGHRLAPYDSHTSILAMGRSSTTLSCRIHDAQSGKAYAEAATVLVCADRSGRSVPIPDDLRARVEAGSVA